jgi:hypothetical protein
MQIELHQIVSRPERWCLIDRRASGQIAPETISTSGYPAGVLFNLECGPSGPLWFFLLFSTWEEQSAD